MKDGMKGTKESSMNEWLMGRILTVSGVLVGCWFAAAPLAAEQPAGELPAARAPAGGLDTPGAALVDLLKGGQP